MNSSFIISTIINILILFFAPFFMIGIIRKTKAFFAGKKGISIFQPFWDFIKLFKKGQVISKTTSKIFNIAPLIILATTIFAGLFAPMINSFSIIEIQGAFIIFSYLLGLGKFFALVSALDTGSSFEGMGASREACFTTIIEPAFFIIIASIVALSGNSTFKNLTMILKNSEGFGFLIITLAVLALLIMLLTECSRVPVDDPATHLELTMIHEAMILDNSGIDLAFLSWSCGIKMVILASLITNLILPVNLGVFSASLAFIGVLILISLLVGIIESAIARFRLSHIFEFIFVMSSFALIIASLTAVKIYGV